MSTTTRATKKRLTPGQRQLAEPWPPEAVIPHESTEFATVSGDGKERYAEVRYRCMRPWQEHVAMRLYASVTEQGVVLTVKTEERVLACLTVPRPVTRPNLRRRK